VIRWGKRLFEIITAVSCQAAIAPPFPGLLECLRQSQTPWLLWHTSETGGERGNRGARRGEGRGGKEKVSFAYKGGGRKCRGMGC